VKIPYCVHFYTLEACKEIAEKARATGLYQRVWITKPITEDGKKFARVWVERKPEAK
jgi:hypothetical protein